MVQATTQTNLRENMKKYLDDVATNGDTLIVTRKNDENVVVISQAEYNSLQETYYLLGNKANHDDLLESIAQLEAGKGKEMPLDTFDDWRY